VSAPDVDATDAPDDAACASIAPPSDATPPLRGAAARLAEERLRNGVLDELLELRAFCAQRHAEMFSEEGSGLAAAASLRAPPAVAHASRDAVAAARDAAAAAAVLLTARRARELLLLAAPKGAYLGRLVASLQQRGAAQRKLGAVLADVEARRQTSRHALASSARELQALQARMRAVKAAAEASLSAAYAGRPVNLIGEVNNCI
jgi:hypothetical protein